MMIRIVHNMELLVSPTVKAQGSAMLQVINTATKNLQCGILMSSAFWKAFSKK